MSTSTDSPTFLFCRASVILGCTLLLPLIAVCWNLLPTADAMSWVAAIMDRDQGTEMQYRLPSSPPKNSTSSNFPGESFVPSSVPQETAFPRNPGGDAVPSPWKDGLPTRSHSTSTPGFDAAIHQKQDGFEQQQFRGMPLSSHARPFLSDPLPVAASPNHPYGAPGTDSARTVSLGASNKPDDRHPMMDSRIAQVSFQPHSASTMDEYRNMASPTDPATAGRQGGFGSMEEELKRLGAQFYRLQTWGKHGELYRFTCFVAAPDNEQYQKHFQTIDSDRLRAMNRTLNDVRLWLLEQSKTSVP